MIKSELVIPKVWRSEIESLALFLFFCLGSIVGSNYLPQTVLAGKLFTLFGYTLELRLPLLWLFFPALCALFAAHKIYNVRYSFDAMGIEVREGILSLHQVAYTVRYEDIRNVDIKQGILDRMLDIGTIEVSTAGTAGVEIVLEGVDAPEEVREMLDRERNALNKIQAKEALAAQQEYMEENS